MPVSIDESPRKRRLQIFSEAPLDLGGERAGGHNVENEVVRFEVFKPWWAVGCAEETLYNGECRDGCLADPVGVHRTKDVGSMSLAMPTAWAGQMMLRRLMKAERANCLRAARSSSSAASDSGCMVFHREEASKVAAVIAVSLARRYE